MDDYDLETQEEEELEYMRRCDAYWDEMRDRAIEESRLAKSWAERAEE